MEGPVRCGKRRSFGGLFGSCGPTKSPSSTLTIYARSSKSCAKRCSKAGSVGVRDLALAVAGLAFNRINFAARLERLQDHRKSCSVARGALMLSDFRRHPAASVASSSMLFQREALQSTCRQMPQLNNPGKAERCFKVAGQQVAPLFDNLAIFFHCQFERQFGLCPTLKNLCSGCRSTRYLESSWPGNCSRLQHRSLLSASERPRWPAHR